MISQNECFAIIEMLYLIFQNAKINIQTQNRLGTILLIAQKDVRQILHFFPPFFGLLSQMLINNTIQTKKKRFAIYQLIRILFL